ncbi:unnamed protein product [Peniophora sp. CBMAI 1063]|nr:unnamed protein product [Peniophora sp. CBMAI 1063]
MTAPFGWLFGAADGVCAKLYTIPSCVWERAPPLSSSPLRIQDQLRLIHASPDSTAANQSEPRSWEDMPTL